MLKIIEKKILDGFYLRAATYQGRFIMDKMNKCKKVMILEQLKQKHFVLLYTRTYAESLKKH